MQGNDQKNQDSTVIMIVERRAQRQPDLDSSEIMQLVRKRAALRKRATDISGDSDSKS
jgi:hypothetical protein